MMVNKTLKNSWPDKLDKACRDTTNGETHGVLIGPHASNVLSELLLTKIDAELRKEKQNWKFVRYIDDYHCYVQTYSEGKIFLSRLDRILRNYDLQLNYKKTKIMELPQYEKSFWTNTIGLYKELLW
jgi:retron-type reverse transcriptase